MGVGTVGLNFVWYGIENVRMELYLHRVYLGMVLYDLQRQRNRYWGCTLKAACLTHSVGEYRWKNGIWSSRTGYFTFDFHNKTVKTLRNSTASVEAPLEQHRAFDTPTRAFVTTAERYRTWVTSLWRKTRRCSQSKHAVPWGHKQTQCGSRTGRNVYNNASKLWLWLFSDDVKRLERVRSLSTALYSL